MPASASRHRGREPLPSQVKPSGTPPGSKLGDHRGCRRWLEGGDKAWLSPLPWLGSVRSLWLFRLAPSAAAGVLLADGPACKCKRSSQRPQGSPAGRAPVKREGFKSLCTHQLFRSRPGLRLQPFPCAPAGLGPGAGCCCSALLVSVLVLKARLRHGSILPLQPGCYGAGHQPSWGEAVQELGAAITASPISSRWEETSSFQKDSQYLQARSSTPSLVLQELQNTVCTTMPRHIHVYLRIPPILE